MKTIQRIVFATVCGMVALRGIPPLNAAEIAVDDLRGIVVAEPPTAAESKALAMLQRGLRLLYDVQLERVEDAEGRVMFLGSGAAIASGLVTQEDLQGVAPGGYVIRGDEGRIAIAGNTGATTAYGVERFLERLGFRFFPDLNGFFRETTYVAAFKPENRMLPALRVDEVPSLLFRSSHSHGMGEWADCSALLREEVEGKTDQWIDHSAGYLVPKDLFYEDHPEYYAMTKDGERIARDAFSYHRTPLCLSNPEVTRVSIERALKWVEEQPDRTFFPISYGDTGLWCQCPDCLALDPAPKEYAARVLQWVNPVARAIREVDPEKIVISFGYGGTGTPPEGMELEKNIHIMQAVPFAGLVCLDHAIEQRHPAFMNAIERIAGWQELAPNRVGVCEYFGGVYYPSLIDSIQSVTRTYVEHGVNAVYFTYGRPRNFPGVWAYVYRQLLWDATRDAMTVAREFVTYNYRPAEKAGAVLEFLELCHQRYQATIGDELDGRPYPTVITFYTDEFADKALAVLERVGERDETKNFILNWMAHPVTRELDEEGRKQIRRQCRLLLELAGEDDKAWAAIMGDLRRTAGLAERARKGAGEVVEAWIEEQFPKP